MPLEQGHLNIYRNLFVSRDDVYALQSPKGAYFTKHSPLTDEVLANHLLGNITAGFYGLDKDSSVSWIALDADSPDGIERLQDAWRGLDDQKIYSLLEKSRRGGHLWILFERVPAKAARRLILGSLPQLEDVEVFPKQDRLTQDSQFGSLMRGPLGIHRLTGKRHPFVDPISLIPVSRSVLGTIEYLAQAPKVTASQVEEADIFPFPESAYFPAPERPTRFSPIQRLKEQIGDPYDFISRFVELDERGKGHCPFHPPDHHPSFAVDRHRGFWIDFHEVNPRTGRYVGGDVVEFYRRLKGLTYKEVLKELGG
jgi:CHC2 zinc finger